uniref:Uncharacterized protein n=1 Tax=Rhizophora mucronata TaxID=61149 RepID=A0A2P2LZL7_RHIMU
MRFRLLIWVLILCCNLKFPWKFMCFIFVFNSDI